MDAEKQEGQKTVVAFIAGLLIGGLLVWVFSSTPDTNPQTDNETATTTEEPADTDNEAAVSGSLEEDQSTNVSEDGSGSLDVEDQTAGNTVTLNDVTYPTTDGWIVVRDYTNGVEGRILGASRYSTTAGLTPTSVSLLRDTVKGSTYKVMFYTENGDKKFSTAGDTAIEADSVTFTAQ
jgi:hypothetical protein